jgi:predicted DsbA family dithiol-disulfide isomerase
MSTHFRIDFVSDVSCPWCVIGLGALERALENLRGEIGAEIHFQPFELNPRMPVGGQDIGEHITEKYGSTPEQQARAREMIRQRGAEVGFTFRMEGRRRIYNTFDAHRLLHWAGEVGRPDGTDGGPGQQRLLKKALFSAYFTDGRSPESHEVLLDAIETAGLDRARAQAILASDEYAREVREREHFYLEQDIHSVPAIIVDERHLIPGGQPVEVFERVLRKIAARAAAQAAEAAEAARDSAGGH